MSHHSGFASIIGKPNVGKSTLLNALLGERLCIATRKAQTTRHRILGIWNDDDHQVVFSDTPGILEPHYKMQEDMMRHVNEALEDADIVVYVKEVREPIDEEVIGKVLKLEKPTFAVLNKIDLGSQEEVEAEILKMQELFGTENVFGVSAKHKFNLKELMSKLLDSLPENPPYYDKEDLTDRPLRFFVSEMIREQILERYKKEVPYSVEVVVNEYKEEEELIRIAAEIHVTRESQRMIMIGKKGIAIKHLSIAARTRLRQFLGKKIFLDMTVKVSKDWRNDERQLKRFGYREK